MAEAVSTEKASFLAGGLRRTLDSVTLENGIMVVAGWLCYALAFSALSCVILPFFRVTNVSSRLRYSLSLSIISGCFASYTALLGIEAVLNLGNDFLYSTYPPILMYGRFGFIYFTYDIVAMFLVYSASEHAASLSWPACLRAHLLRSCDLVVHHLIMGFVIIPFAIFFLRDKGHLVVAVVILHEASTPFLSMHTSLKMLQKTNNWLFICNGAMFIAAFLIFRVCSFPYLYWRYQQYRQMSSLVQVVLSLPWYCNAGSFSIASLQYFWFVKVVRSIVHTARAGGDKGKAKPA
ncbi:TLC domain-containing protein 3A-like [Sycon ciliatum]|uniref:TLC domain-containing protein 3A-like n=1 Tax=Sycon ciliatum TaxID=27933 RepID=UPI0020A9C427|eukprot:scpid83292/ scgid31032/ Protein FAM57A; Protein CT120